ncbi:MAG: (d)CMP kinase [Gemmatimonadaceae bacterium]|nr:(d)CMP kinase [Gemmatimonadaceae bacterium]MCW5825325.1 (d)CMP kinase [Gemmatimonadaceae bacterium]
MTSAPSPVTERRRPLVVAIDGPAASGKSSTAKWVARELGLRHVDSGSLYRAATAAALRSGRAPETWLERDVLAAAQPLHLVPAETTFHPYLGDEDLEAEIRGKEVTANVSLVARMPAVRTWVNAQVRAAAEGHPIVVDGRDMGTAVFPQARVKVFLVADPWERARRRLVQRLQRAPDDAEIAAEVEALVQRDLKDEAQTQQAKDAVLIDTTFLTQEEQVQRIVALARQALKGAP